MLAIGTIAILLGALLIKIFGEPLSVYNFALANTFDKIGIFLVITGVIPFFLGLFTFLWRVFP